MRNLTADNDKTNSFTVPVSKQIKISRASESQEEAKKANQSINLMAMDTGIIHSRKAPGNDNDEKY